MKSSTNFLKLILSTTLLILSNSTVLVKSELAECNFEGIEIEKCLFQQEGCCTVLNQAIQVGFHCLCSLIASSSNGPQLSLLLSGSLTYGCGISIPPITLCQVSAPTPVFLPTETQFSPFTSPKDSEVIQTMPSPPYTQELSQSSNSEVIQTTPSPPYTQELSHSSNCNYMEVGRQPPCLGNGEMPSSWTWDLSRAYHMLTSGGNKDKVLTNLAWLIFSVVCVELLLV